MTPLRILLVLMFISLAMYTVGAVGNDGMNFLGIALTEVTRVTWLGQFAADFATYLILSALWVAWRHHFSAIGIVLGLLASVGGILFLSIYLLVESFKAEGDIARLLLGDRYPRS